MKKFAMLGLCALLAACGGGGGGDSSAPATNTVSVAPSLGRFSAGAVVTIKSLAGAVLGTANTGSDGKASVNIGTHSGPLLIEVTGGTGVTYYDERSKSSVPYGNGETLRAIAPAVQTAIGVTPFTNAAVEAIKAANSGSVPSTISTTNISLANTKIQAAFGITDVLQAPTLVDSSTANSLDLASAGDQYALKLATLAKVTTSGTALDVSKALALDMTDNKLDGLQGTTPLSNPAYNAATVTTDWAAQTQIAAADFATTDTQNLIASNPTVLGTVSTDVSTVIAPPVGTSSTDVQLAKNMFGELRTTLSTYLNQGKTGFLDNQATRANADLAANVAPDLDRLQGRIRTLDMGVSSYYAAVNGNTNGFLIVGTDPIGNAALVRGEGSPYNAFYGISGFKRCWTDSATGVTTAVNCAAASSGNSFFNAADSKYYLRLLRTVITYDSTTSHYNYTAKVIAREFNKTTNTLATAATGIPDSTTAPASGYVTVTQGSPAPAGTIVISGTLPPSTAGIGTETLNVTLTTAYTATNRIRASLTGSVSAPNSADATKLVSLSIDNGTYFDLESANFQTTEPTPVAINFVGTAQTAATKFTGTLAMDTFQNDLDGLNPMFTHGVFDGSISDLTTSGAGKFLTGRLTFTQSNYRQYHSTQPESSTNFVAGTAAFTGTVQAPSRPLMTLDLSATRTSFSTNNATLRFSYGTIIITGTAAENIGVLSFALTNQNGIQVATGSSGNLLVTKAGSTLATVSNSLISYVDGVTESLN